jgi:FkbM family methyltransferase
VSFYFYAPIKIAVKAKNKGVENTLLRHSFKLLSRYKVGSDPIIYDVGANYGFLSMVWGRAFEKRKGKVFSFEPSPNVLNITQKSISFNKLDNVKLFQKAVGDISGHITIHEGKASSNVKKLRDTKQIKVEMTSLDDFTKNQKIESIDLIKIDVDGFEYEVLQGAKDIMKKHKPIFIVETNNDSRILDYFSLNDYVILDMSLNRVFDHNINIPSNIFCVKMGDYKKSSL